MALTEIKYEEKHYMFHNTNGDYIRILKNGNYVIIDDKEDETSYDYLSANEINLQDILKSLPKQFYNLYGKPVNSNISVMEAW